MSRTAALHSPTKEKILKASQKLMLCQGYNASSIDDVCERAKVKKGSFFHYFKNKEQLAQETLRNFLEAAEEGRQNAPFRTLEEPLDRVLGYVDFIASKTLDSTSPKSCLLGILGGELSEMIPSMRKLCLEYFENQIDYLKGELDLAKKQHEMKHGADTRELAEVFISTFQGSMILRRVKQDQKLVARNLEHYKNYIKSIFKK